MIEFHRCSSPKLASCLARLIILKYIESTLLLLAFNSL